MAIPFAFDEMSVYDEMPSFDGFSVYGAPSPTSDTSIYEAAPYSEDFAAMGLTPEQFADIQKSVANMDLSNIGLTGGLGLIGGYGPPGLDESKYMVSAPLSNKGNPTSTLRQSSNDFFVYDNQPVRLVDKATNQIVFEGKGPEDARKASELAAQLTAQGGRKASWDIQTGPGIDLSMYGAGQDTGWKTVANEKENKSTLGTIANVAGTILPIAMIPLTMGASAPLAGLGAAGNVALGAGVGAASAGLKGQNILKGGLMGGLTSAGGQFLSGPLKGVGLGADAARAVGTGIGATAGGLATGQNLQNSLIGGVAAGGTTYLGSKLFGNTPSTDDLVNQNVSRAMSRMENALIDAGAYAPDITDAIYKPVTSGGAKAVSGGQTSFASVPADNLTITGTRIGATPTPSFAVNIPASTPAVGGPDLDEIEVTAQDEGLRQAEGADFAVDTSGLLSPEIIATAQKEAGLTQEKPSLAVLPSATSTPEIIATAQTKAAPVEDKSSFAVDTSGLLTPEIIATAQTEAAQQPKDNSLAVIPAATTGGEKITVTAPKDQAAVKDEGSVGGTYTPPKSDIVVTGDKGTPKFNDKGEYTGPLTNIPSLVDDAVQEELAGKKTQPPKERDLADYLRLLGLAVGLGGSLFGGGGGGAKSPGKYSSTGRLSSTFTDKLPTPGQNGAFTVGGLGGTAADRTLAARPVTDWYRYGMGPAMDIPAGADLSRATSPYAGYGPGTLGEETFKVVSGIPEQPVGMAHGGDMGYSRGSSRESFAVNGPGTGRSDDIPAVLSDGEYVIDAETVALLGDGSSKAGAKKLDQMRVSIRKHKGKNLAKGKFSVNAKRPEAYMSGGRI